MKLTIAAGTLNKMARACAPLARPTAIIPILSCVKLTASKARQSLTMGASDGESRLLTCENACVDEDGEILVAHSRLSALVMYTNGDCQLQKTGDRLVIQVGTTHAWLLTEPPEAFVAMDFFLQDAHHVSIPQLASVFRQTKFACDTSGQKPYLDSICLARFNGSLWAIASDGRKAARARVECDGDFSALIARRSAEVFIAAASESLPDATLRQDVDGTFVYNSHFAFALRNLDFEFPSEVVFQNASPSDAYPTIQVETARALEAITRMEALSPDKIPIVLLKAGDSLSISMESHISSGTQTIEVLKKPPAEFEALFTAQYLREALSAIPTETTLLQYTGKSLIVSSSDDASFSAGIAHVVMR